MNKFHERDIEKLSAYLDGQLSQSDSALIEQRLKTDLELASAFDDIRIARSMLRSLPRRKAPRNFMLSRKLVKANPPVPRVFSMFQFSSAFSALLLIFTFAFNYISPRVSYTAAPNTGYGGGGGGGGYGFGFGMGGGGGVDAPAAAQESAPAAESSLAATETPMNAADAGGDASRKESEEPAPQADALPVGSGPQQREYVIVAPQWQWIIFLLAAVSGIISLGIRWNAKRKWN